MNTLKLLKTALLVGSLSLLTIASAHANLSGSYAKKAEIESRILLLHKEWNTHSWAVSSLEAAGKGNTAECARQRNSLNYFTSAVAREEQLLREIQAKITKQLGEEAARAAAVTAARDAARNAAREAARKAAQNAALAAAKAAARDGAKEGAKTASRNSSKDSGQGAAQSAAHSAVCPPMH